MVAKASAEADCIDHNNERVGNIELFSLFSLLRGVDPTTVSQGCVIVFIFQTTKSLSPSASGPVGNLMVIFIGNGFAAAEKRAVELRVFLIERVSKRSQK